MPENFQKSQVGQMTVFAPGEMDAQDVKDTLAETQRAVKVIAEALTRERIHPAAAYNALLNTWHGVALAISPGDVEPALDKMKEFHRAFVIQMADA